MHQMASSPSNRVVSTVELLESILLHVPLNDLLQFQRVCHRWNDTITTSPSLQQVLFLEPSKISPKNSRFNPLLKALFPPFFEDPMTGHPDLAKCIREMAWYKNPQRRSAILNEKASWRRMFPMQPPVKIKQVILAQCYDCARHGRRLEASRVIRGEYHYLQHNGIRMGLLYDLLVELMEVNFSVEAWADWGWLSVPAYRKNISKSDLTAEELERKVAARETYMAVREDHWHINDLTWTDDDRRTGLKVAKFDMEILELE